MASFHDELTKLGFIWSLESFTFCSVNCTNFITSRLRNRSRMSKLCTTVALPCGLLSRNLLVQGGDTIGEVARGMIEDVHGAIFDLVQLMKTYQSKNKLSRLFMSTLFKRRQEELNAVVDQAIMRLQVSEVS